MMRRTGFVALIIFLALGFSGCWDRIEIEDVAIVGAMGIDKGQGDNVVVSLEITNPGALAIRTHAATSQSPVVSIVTRDEASTIRAAITNAQRRTPRRIVTGLIGTVVFGQSLAREGIGQYIDYLVRNARVRSSAVLATCDSGAGLLQRPFLSPLPSRTLAGLSESAPASGMTMTATITEFAAKLSEPGIEPITLHTVGRKTKDVQVKRQGEEVKQTDPAVMLEEPIDVDITLDGELPADSPVLSPYRESSSGEFVPGITIDIGIAAYRDDKMVGLLDGVEARGYLWATGKLEEGTVEVPDPGGSGKTIALSIIRSSASIKPVLDEEVVRMDVELHVDLETREGPLDTDMTNETLLQALEDSIDALILHEARATLNRVQKELKSDIYGFGNRVYRANPKLWAQLEPRWNDEVFPNLEVRLQVSSRVRAPGAAYGLSAR
jgi:spore germination protein KC